MSDAAYDAFLTSIIKNLETNGFPSQKVSLPLERMYEVAHQKGLNFNKALSLLEAKAILHEKTTTKIIFFSQVDDVAPDAGASFKAAAEMLKNMSADERQRLEELYRNMSPEQLAEMKRQAEAMGLLKPGMDFGV